MSAASPWRRHAAALLLTFVTVAPGPDAGAANASSCPSGRTEKLPSGTGEASGIAASTRFPHWGWMVRDSGNPPILYALRFRSGGKPLVREFRVAGANNTDWEDVVYASNRDGTGRLYVVESGQSRRDHHIYKVPEPDPLGEQSSIRSHRYRYSYPDGRRFNTEAAFFHRSRLVLVTKTTPARVYRFEQRLSERDVNVPRFVGELRGARTVSVVRVSPDGQHLVAANHRYLFAYRASQRDAELGEFVGRSPYAEERIGRDDNVEAGDFFPFQRCHLVLVAESKNVYRKSVD